MSSTGSHKVYRVSDFRTSPTGLPPSSPSHSSISEYHALPHRPSRGFSSDSLSSQSRRSRSENPIVIAVMGVTGSGKSTFISRLAPNEGVKVGHSLHSSTAEVQLASFPTTSGRTGFLIDTPGFDDTNRSDTEILKEIATFLAKLYRDGIYVTGIIYMHRITDVRMQGSAIKNLEVFRRLCGEQCFPQVALVSTMWQTLKGVEGERVANAREEELRTNPEFWGKMVDRGSQTFRYHDTKSAAAIMNWFLNNPSKLSLSIQTEMVDQNLSLDQTEAGEYLGKDFARVKRKYEQEITALTTQIREAQEDDDGSMKDFLISQQRDVKSKLIDKQQELKGLRVDFRDLIVEKTPEYAARIAQMEQEEMTEVSEAHDSGDRSQNHSKIQQLESHISELERECLIIEKQMSQEIEAVRRQDSAKAQSVISKLEKRYNEALHQLEATLHSEIQKRKEAEGAVRARRQAPGKLEFMRRHFGKGSSHSHSRTTRESSHERSITLPSPRWADDRHAPASPRKFHRAETWEPSVGMSSRGPPPPAAMTQMGSEEFGLGDEDLVLRSPRRTRTGEERRPGGKTPPRRGMTEGGWHR